jgi:tetratricopeptide (TPR) repeat protein
MSPRTFAPLVAAINCFFAAGLAETRAAAWSSADELVRQAREHEAAHEEDVAARRYTEALTLDGASEAAWVGLGELRMRLGEPAEAERVYSAALARVPALRRALEGRARARWALGRYAEAEADLQAYAELSNDTSAFRALADWFGTEGRAPAQLATWRRLFQLSRLTVDPGLESEARRMIRALLLVVDGADPASSPIDADATRLSLAEIARKPR